MYSPTHDQDRIHSEDERPLPCEKHRCEQVAQIVIDYYDNTKEPQFFCTRHGHEFIIETLQQQKQIKIYDSQNHVGLWEIKL